MVKTILEIDGMTEKEKMLKGELYNADYDPELIAERTQAKDLCFELNNTTPSDLETRIDIIKKLLGKTGEEFHIESDFWCDYGYRIELGENFYANHGVVMLDAGGISFGDNVFIAPQCGFHTSGHPLEAEVRNTPLEYAKPIKVGDSVWFGAGVQVCPGVTIGSNVVIGAGSVVIEDIPSNCVAVGNPCRVVKEI